MYIEIHEHFEEIFHQILAANELLRQGRERLPKFERGNKKSPQSAGFLFLWSDKLTEFNACTEADKVAAVSSTALACAVVCVVVKFQTEVCVFPHINVVTSNPTVLR